MKNTLNKLSNKTLNELYTMLDEYKMLESQLDEKGFKMENLRAGIKRDLALINNEIFNKITA